MFACKRLGEERGAALMVALGVLSIMVIIGVMVSVLSMNSSKIIGHDTRATVSQNLAEAGIDEVIAVTLANYNDIYPGGSLPDSNYPGDGMPFYAGPQEITDGQGSVTGSYEAWTKEDPDRPGNVLITAAGSTTGGSPETTVVRVSVQYTASIFDYVLLPGTPANPSNTEFRAGRSDDDSSGAGNSSITITGKVHVNGNMSVNTPDSGSSDGSSHAGGQGTVAFLSRDGFTDTVTYTDSFTGESPTGNQPTVGNAVNFPTIDFSSFSNVNTVTFPANGVPPGGWTRGSGSQRNTFTISATDFELRYGSFDVVKFEAVPGGTVVQITGNCNSEAPAVITSTLMFTGGPGNSGRIAQINVIGPGVALRPDNGLAILSGKGNVQLQNGVQVGTEGAGALIYMSGQNGSSEFEINGNFNMFGSVVVNSAVVLGAVTTDNDSGSDDHGSGMCDSDSHSGSGGSSDSHSGGSSGADISIEYDPAFLSNMPPDWWDGGDFTAVKINYERA